MSRTAKKKSTSGKKPKKDKALWGGRFKKAMSPLLKEFSYSLRVDGELLASELEVNGAWARMLARIGLITAAESKKLITALEELTRELKDRDLGEMAETYEDVHTLIQQHLEKKVGVLGKKIHTGRSRNDLVVTSTRIYLKKRLKQIVEDVSISQRALVGLAVKAGNEVVAGMTHLRMAQPVLMAHHLLAYVEMLEEDKQRFQDTFKRLDVMPLGSAALAGSSLPIDQKFLADELGFSKIATNSMAAVGDRAFVTEFVSGLAILWMHLSRLSEDFVLWNSEAFHYVELDDAYATGSSLMPQKKNPDVFELLRGRSGVIFGYLMTLLTLQKALPLAYNRDLQEDKPSLFDAIRKTDIALRLLAPTLESITFNHESMELSVQEDNLYATDVLEYLVQKGMPFSEAHETVGEAVRYGVEHDKALRELSDKEWQSFSPLFDDKVYDLFEPMKSVSAKKTTGSTAPQRVAQELARWQRQLKMKE